MLRSSRASLPCSAVCVPHGNELLVRSQTTTHASFADVALLGHMVYIDRGKGQVGIARIDTCTSLALPDGRSDMGHGPGDLTAGAAGLFSPGPIYILYMVILLLPFL